VLGNKNVLIVEGVTVSVRGAVVEPRPADSEASAAASLGPSLPAETQEVNPEERRCVERHRSIAAHRVC